MENFLMHSLYARMHINGMLWNSWKYHIGSIWQNLYKSLRKTHLRTQFQVKQSPVQTSVARLTPIYYGCRCKEGGSDYHSWPEGVSQWGENYAITYKGYRYTQHSVGKERRYLRQVNPFIMYIYVTLPRFKSLLCVLYYESFLCGNYPPVQLTSVPNPEVSFSQHLYLRDSCNWHWFTEGFNVV